MFEVFLLLSAVASLSIPYLHFVTAEGFEGAWNHGLYKCYFSVFAKIGDTISNAIDRFSMFICGAKSLDDRVCDCFGLFLLLRLRFIELLYKYYPTLFGFFFDFDAPDFDMKPGDIVALKQDIDVIWSSLLVTPSKSGLDLPTCVKESLLRLILFLAFTIGFNALMYGLLNPILHRIFHNEGQEDLEYPIDLRDPSSLVMSAWCNVVNVLKNFSLCYERSLLFGVLMVVIVYLERYAEYTDLVGLFLDVSGIYAFVVTFLAVLPLYIVGGLISFVIYVYMPAPFSRGWRNLSDLGYTYASKTYGRKYNVKRVHINDLRF